MLAKLTAAAIAILAVASITNAQAEEPKRGGILKIYHRETPPSPEDEEMQSVREFFCPLVPGRKIQGEGQSPQGLFR